VRRLEKVVTLLQISLAVPGGLVHQLHNGAPSSIITLLHPINHAVGQHADADGHQHCQDGCACSNGASR
jgi:hypothetical protein